MRLSGGSLALTASAGAATAVQSIVAPSFVVETTIETPRLKGGAWAGLAIYGDGVNYLALVSDGRTIQVRTQRRGERRVVAEVAAAAGTKVPLRIACVDGSRFRFAVQNRADVWEEVAGETDGNFLPPWDRGVRAGVVVFGESGAEGAFAYFSSTPDDGKLFAR